MIAFRDWLVEILNANGFEYQEKENETICIPEIDYSLRYCKIGERNLTAIPTAIIWEDWWVFKQEILKSKVMGKLGLLEKVPARLCSVRRINKPDAEIFLNDNHLQGAVNAKVHYGVFLPEKYFRVLKVKPQSKDLLLAVMPFSGRRVFKDGSLSYELVRYCVRKGYSLQGGFTKAFRAFVKEKDPDSVMTYADLDWYSSGIYEKFGFVEEGFHPPIHFKVNEDGERVKVELGEKYDVSNKGSLRMVWKKK